MYNIENKVLAKILKKRFKSLVGVSCERFEKFLKDKNVTISSEEVEDYLFNFKKDAYNTMRNIDDQIFAFSQGTKINIKLDKPVSK